MKTECESDSATQPTEEQPWRKVAAKMLGSTGESRPLITCECALWGSPCPNSLWSEDRPTAPAEKAA